MLVYSTNRKAQSEIVRSRVPSVYVQVGVCLRSSHQLAPLHRNVQHHAADRHPSKSICFITAFQVSSSCMTPLDVDLPERDCLMPVRVESLNRDWTAKPVSWWQYLFLKPAVCPERYSKLALKSPPASSNERHNSLKKVFPRTGCSESPK